MDTIVETDFGFAIESKDPPWRRDMNWRKIPEGHIYTWDGDGWVRIQPPERVPMAAKDLPHG